MPPAASRPPVLSRRCVLSFASMAAGLWAAGGVRPAGAGSALQRLHTPILRLPVVTANGAKVPITVEVGHPMEPDHYITSLRVVNERDPVPSKGVFSFSAANGQAYVAFQARLDQGVSEVSVTAECNRHGRWSSTASVNVPSGGGGCAGDAPPADRSAGPDILPPRLRIPQMIKHGRLRPDDIVDVQLTMRHPNRTGLAFRDGRFVQESEPFHLQDMEVFAGPDRVSRFALTSALSDDPLITFRLRARQETTLRAVLVNTRGQRFEATHPLRLS
jgi:desulfoferrodoxin (superoxide reductase-like protein)